MIENHAGEQWSSIMVIEYSGSSVAYTISRHYQYSWGTSTGLTRGKHENDWVEVHEEYIAMWNNQLGQVPQMDHALDL
ncbi:hypothetical protein PVK06_004528 [Gossypium arboreum]|uniref:Uncharacterized protein n=1 Tax=Gossypium arboreum TaxID=29729 RepID=A0ABR0QTH9_GOSAR|nr:hypothetical protein PVK06_004528 [Gossypium arboreum]